jgi:cytidine deaminase
MKITDEALLEAAIGATHKARLLGETREGWKFTGSVGAALVTEQGNVFTGINLDLFCGIGFCAEHSAVAEMVKNGETRIARVVAATFEGSVLPPCGRCRELIFEIDSSNIEAEILLGGSRKRPLRELLPHIWQEAFGKSLYSK